MFVDEAASTGLAALLATGSAADLLAVAFGADDDDGGGEMEGNGGAGTLSVVKSSGFAEDDVLWTTGEATDSR